MQKLTEDYQLDALKDLREVVTQLRNIAVCLGRCEQSYAVHDAADSLYTLILIQNDKQQEA